MRKHWDGRAAAFGADAAATLEDLYLRALEIRFMRQFLARRKVNSVLDIGCGNGYSTHIFARTLQNTRFIGVDYSPPMISAARAYELPNCRFVVGDVLRPETLPQERFDAVITQRCIQNILDRVDQRRAIANMCTLVAPGGVVALMECSNPGLAQFNAVAKTVKESRAPKVPPVHNLWFDDAWLVSEFGAQVVHFCSVYMLFKAISGRLRWLGYRLPQLGAFGYDRVFLIHDRANADSAI